MSELVYLGGASSRAKTERRPARIAAEPMVVDAMRPSPLDWVRNRRAERENRRAEAAHQKLAQRMRTLGEEWRVLDLKAVTGRDRTSFLAMGPTGVFAVTVKEHGRSRVMFAGDIVQIDGRRPKYVDEARDNAKVASEALSRTAGISIPVMPVLAFAGSGMISFYGMPKRCLVTSYEELSRVLNARSPRLGQDTVEKLFQLATHPTTWVNEPYVALADRDGYMWYPDGTQATDGVADKRVTHR